MQVPAEASPSVPSEQGRDEPPTAERPDTSERPAAQAAAPAAPAGSGIAIVGMACRFPGAPDLHSFWRQLEAGENAVTDGRPDPGPWNGAFGDPANPDPSSRVGAFVEGIDQFDAGFFKIRPIEARMMDPQQRMLLETSWQALEDAGIDPASLKGSRAGVYAGIGGNSEYRGVIAAAGRGDSYFGTTSSVGRRAGRFHAGPGRTGPALRSGLRGVAGRHAPCRRRPPARRGGSGAGRRGERGPVSVRRPSSSRRWNAVAQRAVPRLRRGRGRLRPGRGLRHGGAQTAGTMPLLTATGSGRWCGARPSTRTQPAWASSSPTGQRRCR